MGGMDGMGGFDAMISSEYSSMEEAWVVWEVVEEAEEQSYTFRFG